MDVIDGTRGLREFMARHRINQAELARRTGLHEVTVSRLMTGAEPKRSTLELILRFCRSLEPSITYEDLFLATLAEAS